MIEVISVLCTIARPLINLPPEAVVEDVNALPVQLVCHSFHTVPSEISSWSVIPLCLCNWSHAPVVELTTKSGVLCVSLHSSLDGVKSIVPIQLKIANGLTLIALEAKGWFIKSISVNGNVSTSPDFW